MANANSYPHSITSDEQALGFCWRLDEFEKVLLYERVPVGSVTFDIRSPKAKRPWLAHTSTGVDRHARFEREQEAVAFIEAAKPDYLAFVEYRRLNPPAPGHSTPPPGS